MGVDLTLLPLLGEDTWAAHDMLSINRRRDLWEPIAALPQMPIPEPLNCFVAPGERYGAATETPYGEPLKYTTAADLLTLQEHPCIRDDWQNTAVWAYLANMPPDWRIVLYWH